MESGLSSLSLLKEQSSVKPGLLITLLAIELNPVLKYLIIHYFESYTERPFMKFLSLLVFAFSINALAAGGGTAVHKGSHNMDIFPVHQADASLSTIPAKPALVAPAFGAKVPAGSVALQWKAVDTAQVYHVQVASDANFKWIVQEDHFVKATEFQASGLEAGKSYYWRVAAVKSDNMTGTMKSNFAANSFLVK